MAEPLGIYQFFGTRSLTWVFLQALLDEVLCLEASNAGKFLIVWLVKENFLIEFFLVIGVEGIVTLKDPVSDATNGPNVNFVVMLFALGVNNLRCHEMRCAQTKLQ